jgi:hypothetical protein
LEKIGAPPYDESGPRVPVERPGYHYDQARNINVIAAAAPRRVGGNSVAEKPPECKRTLLSAVALITTASDLAAELLILNLVRRGRISSTKSGRFPAQIGVFGRVRRSEQSFCAARL